VYLDTSDYNGASYYFEAILQNSHASSQTFRVVNSNLDTEATITVPGSTTTWTRYRVALTPDNDYPLKSVWSGATEISTKNARIIILQDAADITDTQTQIEVGAYEIFGAVASAETYYPLTEPKYWKYESAKWDPTPTFTLGFTAVNENDMDFSRVALQESSDAAFTSPSTVTNSVVSFDSETVAYYESSTFTATNGYYYRLAYTNDNTMYGGTIYNAKIIATQTVSLEDVFVGGGAGGNLAIYGDGGGNEEVGQSFTTGSPGYYCSKVRVVMEATGSPSDGIVAKIRSSSIDGSVIATSDTKPASEITSLGDYFLNFSNPALLAASTTYYLTLERTSSRDTSNYIAAVYLTASQITGGYYTKSSGSWGSAETSDLRISTYRLNGITKLQNEYLMISEAQTGTGLQEFQTYYDADEWDDGAGGKPTFYHEHSADSGSSNTKLQDDLGGTPTDITNSSITGDDLTRGSAMTLTDNEEIDTNIVTA
jgi:hypothetical protein